MARYLCRVCRYAVPMTGRVAKVLTMYLHCTQGVRGAPYRLECPVFVREPGADDESTSVRLWPNNAMSVTERAIAQARTVYSVF